MCVYSRCWLVWVWLLKYFALWCADFTCLDTSTKVSSVLVCYVPLSYFKPPVCCAGYGVTTNGETVFVNASTCTLRYKPTNPALVFDVPAPTGK